MLDLVCRVRHAALLLLIVWLVACAGQSPASVPTPTPTASATPTPRIGVAFATRPPATIAIVQITPSPLPTATPTATPTPIVYQVQAGDTIWSIAYTHSTLPDDLLALNPAVRPELLQIGQQLILPPPATPIFGDGRGTPVPLNVIVSDVRLYRTAGGGAWLIGELHNAGSVPAEALQVTATLAGAGGVVLGEVVAWGALSLVPPDGRTPFAARLPGIAEDAQISATSITAGASAVTLGNRSFALAVTDVMLDVVDERVRVSGRVQNVDDVPLEQIALTATLYAADGAPAGFSQLIMPDALAAGAQQSFELSVAPPGPRPVTVAVVAQGLRAAPPAGDN